MSTPTDSRPNLVDQPSREHPSSDRPWWAAPETGEQPPVSPPGDQTPPQPPAPRRPRWGRVAGVGALVTALALGSGLAGAELALRSDGGTTATVTNSGTVQDASSGAATESLAKVAAAVQPSVVSIQVRSGQSGDEGSGVIISSSGSILTNNHVVEAAAAGGSITVTFSDGTTADASIVGRDATTDLAVIKAANVSGLTPATFGDSDDVHVGDTVLALGSPLGLEGSVTSGIVSALHRPVSVGSATGGRGASYDALQTDAAINPGNSGGALVDAKGRVIGINSAIASVSDSSTSQSGNIGVGFAIPINQAKRVATQLQKGETVTHPVLGVQISDVSGGGARVEAVTSGGGADKAGLQVGDVITAIGSSKVDDASVLTALIQAHQPGDVVRVTYTRDGDSHTAQATLSSAS